MSSTGVLPERTHPPLRNIRLLPGSPFYDRQKDMLEFLADQDTDSMLCNFRKAAGLPAGTAKPMTGWDSWECKLRGHTTGHYLSGISLAYAATGDEVFRDKASAIVEGLSECQKAFTASGKVHPGFLSAYDEEQFDLLEELTPYPEIWAPYYTLDKIMTGLLDSYKLAGITQAAEILDPLGDWIYERLSRLSHGGNKLTIATCLTPRRTRTLNGVRAVHNHAVGIVFHQGDIAEVHYKIVVTINISALREPHFLSACLFALLNGILHIFARKELRLLDVHRLTRLRRSNEQIRLSAKEGWNLQHVNNLSRCLCLITLMHVRQKGESILRPHIRQHLQALFQTRTAEGMNGCAIRLVKRRFEIHFSACLFLNLCQLCSNNVQEFCRLNHAGTSYK